MRIAIEFENEFEVTARLTDATPGIVRELAETIPLLSEELSVYVVEQKLSGQVLKRQTGNLQSSVKVDPLIQTESEITGSVFQDPSIASYGYIHEFGGDIPSRRGSPLMHWIGREGEDVYRAFAKGFTLPERSFMRSALEDMAPEIEQQLIIAVARGIERA